MSLQSHASDGDADYPRQREAGTLPFSNASFLLGAGNLSASVGRIPICLECKEYRYCIAFAVEQTDPTSCSRTQHVEHHGQMNAEPTQAGAAAENSPP